MSRLKIWTQVELFYFIVMQYVWESQIDNVRIPPIFLRNVQFKSWNQSFTGLRERRCLYLEYSFLMIDYTRCLSHSWGHCLHFVICEAVLVTKVQSCLWSVWLKNFFDVETLCLIVAWYFASQNFSRYPYTFVQICLQNIRLSRAEIYCDLV